MKKGPQKLYITYSVVYINFKSRKKQLMVIVVDYRNAHNALQPLALKGRVTPLETRLVLLVLTNIT